MTTPVTDRADHAADSGVPVSMPAGIPPCCFPGSAAHSLPAPLPSNTRLAASPAAASTSTVPGR